MNKEAIEYVEEQLVEAYADCKKCTTEGRALMSLDQSVLKKAKPIRKYEHSWEYTTNFIQAYYLQKDDFIEWVGKHPEYPIKAHLSFLKIGRASEHLKRNEKKAFEQEINRVYQIAKEKEAEKLREEHRNKQNKPNMKEIKQSIRDLNEENEQKSN